MKINIEIALRTTNLFSDQEITTLFRKYDILVDANAIRMRSDIDKLQQVIEYFPKQGRQYEENMDKLNALSNELDIYVKRRAIEYINATVDMMVKSKHDIDTLRNYFNKLANVMITKDTSAKDANLIQFSRAVTKRFETMNLVSKHAGHQK